MKIAVFLLFVLTIYVQSLEWIEKPKSNAFTLIEKLPAFISTETYTIQYRFDINILHDSINKINSELIDIKNHCSERNLRDCTKLLRKLNSNSERLQVKLNSLYTRGVNVAENSTKIFSLEKCFMLPSNQSISQDTLHFKIENCILDIQNLDNLILAMEIQLEFVLQYNIGKEIRKRSNKNR